MLKFNQRKIQILGLFAAGANMDAKELSRGLNISLPNAEMCLVRLQRQGLLIRVKTEGVFKKPAFTYRVTDKGLARLQYLKKQPQG